MTARKPPTGPKVVDLPPRNPGNGAVEVLDDYFLRGRYLQYMVGNETNIALTRTDHLLSWLWGCGFKVVPVEEPK